MSGLRHWIAERKADARTGQRDSDKNQPKIDKFVDTDRPGRRGAGPQESCAIYRNEISVQRRVMSTLSAAGALPLTDTVTRRSPNCGWRNVISWMPSGSCKPASGVSPTFFPSTHTSAHGDALRFTVPRGSSVTDRTSPGSISTVCTDVYPRSRFVSVRSWRPGLSINRDSSVVPMTRPPSATSSTNGAKIPTHPEKIGTSSFSVRPASIRTLRLTEPEAVVSVTECRPTGRASSVSGDSPAGLPSIRIFAPAGCVSISSRPVLLAAGTGAAAAAAGTLVLLRAAGADDEAATGAVSGSDAVDESRSRARPPTISTAMATSAAAASFHGNGLEVSRCAAPGGGAAQMSVAGGEGRLA